MSPEVNAPRDDEPQFIDEDRFLRRVPLDDIHVKDGKVTSAAFQNDTDADNRDTKKFSVFWHAKATVSEALKGHSNFSIAMLTAGHYRAEEQEIIHTPIDHPAHCDVVGEKTISRRRRLSKLADFPYGDEPGNT